MPAGCKKMCVKFVSTIRLTFCKNTWKEDGIRRDDDRKN